MQNLYDYIIIRENVIPQPHIEELMLLTNTDDTSQATVFKEPTKPGEEIDKTKDGGREDLRVRNTLWYPISEEQVVKLEQGIAQAYGMFVQPRYNCEFKNYEPAQFLGYPVGGHYLQHIDGEQINQKTGEWEEALPRDISFLFYLNSEFGGGEIEFPTLGLTIKPKKGMMIAFPSYKEFPHKVHPVTWGHRYTIVSWVGTKKKLYDTIPTAGV
tara:strand:+ start:4334 stop:4972 length:639 start_codon:yes stop_codon:yes gene_type:complete